MDKATHTDVRLRVPERHQVAMVVQCPDELIDDADHPVRVIWAVVERLDLSAFHAPIKARDGVRGRDATDPRLLVSLWLYACTDGVGSARELARLCLDSRPYQWLCGGVSINYHMLSDFRSSGGQKWDELLTQIVGTMLDAGLVKMDRVAQDGMRVRASAGKSSFHRRSTLEECLQAAREQVETLKRLAEEDTANLTRRQRAAREHAAREQQQRVEEAMRQCEELQQQRDASCGRARARARARPPTPRRGS
jgi:transposase